MMGFTHPPEKHGGETARPPRRTSLKNIGTGVRSETVLPKSGKGEKGFFLWSFAPKSGAKTPLAGQTIDSYLPEQQNQDGKCQNDGVCVITINHSSTTDTTDSKENLNIKTSR